ncbi:glycosyltransferase [Ferruginibacter albus]|uniref:glycosyltransferase n=1 Tax=Ferruginibacter albus TaxID=2875540 RepID=UPI001CC64AFC|nr:glycosyltransferase [Ferruginibacter albus]UAY52247.1 glycosyltransferase [Ferruginibacter albus]
MQKILFVVSFPKKLNSSARFRIELYEDILREHQFELTTKYFWSARLYSILYKKGNGVLKFLGLLAGFARRFALLPLLPKYDYIFILREATPIGPPIFEWLFTRVFRKKIIYDFDDAIWISQASKNNLIAKSFKATWKVGHICKWAYKVSVGNNYLYNYASNYSKNVFLNPTCVDTKLSHNSIKNQHLNGKRLVIGWTGSFSTLVHLNYVLEALQELEKKYDFDFLVIADQNPALPLKNFVFKYWKEDSEIADLLESNIGMMPLYETDYTLGKCGFKLIQFMALGIPVVASPVGVNTKIIEEGIDGFLCQSKQEWIDSLEKLIVDHQLRERMGKKGREKIESFYSVESNKNNFLSLFS